MKKVLIGFVCVVLAWFIGSGFMAQTSAYIADGYTVSRDGCEITFRVGVGSSMGYVRGFRDDAADGVHRLKFYSAWGGFNSSVGAKNEFTLRLNPDDTQICVWRGEAGYAPALTKDADSGEWR